MTAIQFMEFVLNDRWVASASSVPGRTNDVPKPNIVREGSEERRRADPSQEDILILKDGGITDISAQSFGWSEESRDSHVSIELRTTGEAGSVPGRERLWGTRDANNDGESYGGLVGETKRIVDEIRRGHKEFNLIVGYEANDLSGQFGGLIWAASFEVRLDERAVVIDPSTI